MQHILNQYKMKLFGLKKPRGKKSGNNVAFCVETQVIDKYRTINQHIDIINECIDARILHVVQNMNMLNRNDIIYVTLKKRHVINITI